MTRPRVLLADDHKQMLETVRRLLEPEFDVVGAVENGQQALEAFVRLVPDVVVLDVSMPVMRGMEVASRIWAGSSGAKVVFLTNHADRRLVEEAFSVGVLGYVLKSRLASDLIPAIQNALIGKRFVSASEHLKKTMAAAAVSQATVTQTESVNTTVGGPDANAPPELSLTGGGNKTELPPEISRLTPQLHPEANRQFPAAAAALLSALITTAAFGGVYIYHQSSMHDANGVVCTSSACCRAGAAAGVRAHADKVLEPEPQARFSLPSTRTLLQRVGTDTVNTHFHTAEGGASSSR